MSYQNMSQATGPRTTHPLSAPSDNRTLTETMCLVRSQLEAFVVTEANGKKKGLYELNYRARLSDGQADVGRVGIRCMHCHSSKEGVGGEEDEPARSDRKRLLAPSAAMFPKSIRLVYQAARNWQRYHLMQCPAVPGDVKERYQELKKGGKRERSTKASPQYWEECCRKMGMVDGETLGSAEGIRLRTGEFEEVAEGGATLEARKCAPSTMLVSGASTSPLESSAATGKGVMPGSSDAAVAQGSLVARLSLKSLPSPELVNMAVRPEAADQNRQDALFVSVGNVNSGERYNSEASSVEDLVSSDDIMSDAVALLPGAPSVQEQQSDLASINNIISDGTALLPGASSVQEQQGLGGDPLLHGPIKSCESTSTSPKLIHDFTLSNTLDASNTSTDVSAMVDRLQASLSVVEAVRQKLCFQSKSLSKNHDGQPEDEDSVLPLIGAEMYELFVGIPPLGQISPNGARERNESVEADLMGPPGGFNGDCNNRARRCKRDRRRETGSSPLVDLGIPPAVCALVSRLLDHKAYDDPGGGISANGRKWHRHGAERRNYLIEVEEDLRFLATRPDLLRANNVGNGELQIPPNDGAIFGREEEIATLIDAYDRVTDTRSVWSAREAVLVSGYSGTGKSSLVECTCAHLAKRGASFIFGKFDAMRQLRPLSAIVSALGDYCDLLARDEGRIEQVKQAVTAAIGGSAGSRVLTNLVPNMHKIVENYDSDGDSDGSSDRSPLAPSGRDAIKRLAFQFRMLFRATCSRENPVVMCLDDLQWADEVSLDLMHALVTDSEIQGLLFIACYRDNEVGADHPLMACLESIRQSNSVNTSSIHLGNLNIKQLNELVAESFCLPPGTTLPLAKAVMSKTDGNALFSVQFLTSLSDEGLLYFSLTSRRWEWDINQIISKDISDNVVELMVVKLLRLEPNVQEALKMAAAFGAQSKNSLFEIIDRSADSAVGTVSSLDIAVIEGLLIKSGSSYRFSHDQIQFAAYLLIPGTDQPLFHLKIGRLLWKLASEEELDEHLFVVVDQLHRGVSLITDKSEKINLCQLCLLAGQKASIMSAFLPASSYLKSGISLLAEEDWDIDRRLCFDLYNSCAEIEYVLGDFSSMNTHIEEVLKRASTLEEQLRANFTRVQSLGSMGYVSDAIDNAMNVLRQLGESLAACATKEAMQSEMAMTRDLLLSKSDDEILQLALMEDPEKLAAMKFLQLITLYVFTEKKDYFPGVVCRMTCLTLSGGLCTESAISFASYGVCISLRDSSLAYRLGRISLTLLKRFRSQRYLAKVYTCVYGFINPMVEPIQASLPCLKEAVEIGLATGDTEMAMTAARVYLCDSLFSGKALGPLAEEVDKYLQLMIELKQHVTISLNQPVREFIQKLLGLSAIPLSQICEEAGQDESTSGTHSSQLGQIFLIWYHYLFGMYDVGWETIKGGVAGERFFFACTCTFYKCLTALALARKERKKTYMETIEKGFAQMKTWAASTSWNCEHKLELMKAEYAYLEGNRGDASRAYDVAIDLAQKRSFIHEQALGLERAGIFHLENCDNSKASEYFLKAFDCYEKWGACSKAAYIKERYL